MPRTKFVTCFTAGLLAAVTAASAHADTVWLKDGSIVKGDVLEISDSHLEIDTDFAGDINIDLDDIDSVRSYREMTITFTDDSERTGYLRKMPDGRVYLSATPPPDPSAATAAGTGDFLTDSPETLEAAAGAVPAPRPDPENDAELLDLSSVHKMARTRPYFWYESNIDLGVNAASGNSQTAAANISGAFRPRFGKNLIDIDGQANYQEANSDVTAANWRTQINYTRELTTRWGATGFLSFENDEQQDLDLRTTAGLGMSHIFIDRSSTYLDGVLGLAYVNEAYECPNADIGINCNRSSGAPPAVDPFETGRQYGAIRWQAGFSQDLWTDDIAFYHRHRLTQGVISERQFIALTTSGLDLDVWGDISLKLELQFDYNTKPVGGNKNEDLRYLVKLSYDFEGDQNDWWK